MSNPLSLSAADAPLEIAGHNSVWELCDDPPSLPKGIYWKLSPDVKPVPPPQDNNIYLPFPLKLHNGKGEPDWDGPKGQEQGFAMLSLGKWNWLRQRWPSPKDREGWPSPVNWPKVQPDKRTLHVTALENPMETVEVDYKSANFEGAGNCWVDLWDRLFIESIKQGQVMKDAIVGKKDGVWTAVKNLGWEERVARDGATFHPRHSGSRDDRKYTIRTDGIGFRPSPAMFTRLRLPDPKDYYVKLSHVSRSNANGDAVNLTMADPRQDEKGLLCRQVFVSKGLLNDLCVAKGYDWALNKGNVPILNGRGEVCFFEIPKKSPCRAESWWERARDNGLQAVRGHPVRSRNVPLHLHLVPHPAANSAVATRAYFEKMVEQAKEKCVVNIKQKHTVHEKADELLKAGYHLVSVR